jgi:zinc protease
MVRKALAAVLVGLTACIAAAAGATPTSKEGPVIDKYTLPNGLTVVIRENHSSPVVAVQVWVKAGSTAEPERLAGISHILEHMAFKGTKTRGPGQIAREVEALGGDINAYTSFDQTVYHITISGRYLANALDILADTLANSVFDAEELAREKEVVLEEYRMNQDDPGRVTSRSLFREAYRVHPYGRPVIGYEETIKRVTRDDLVAYFERYYNPGNMVLVIAGDVDPQAARPLIERAFLPLGDRSGPRAGMAAEPRQEGVRVTVQEREVRRAYLNLGFHGPSMRSEDVFAWDLLSLILGGGQTSRLYHKVKEKGLVDSVSASSYTPKDPGLLIVGATGSAEKFREALKAILVETFRMAAAPPEGKELARAKTVTESDFVYSLESQGSLARHIGFFEVTLGDAGFEREYIERIRAVSAADIVSVGKKYLTPAVLTVSAVVPHGETGILPEAEIARIAEEAYAEAMADSEEKPATGPTVVKEVLANGIRVVVREDRSVPVVSVAAGFLAGLRSEPADKGGISAMTAEMLTKGTAAKSAREIAEAVEDIAADLWGFSGRNSFGLRGKFLRRDFGKGFGLFAESLRTPAFPADELEKKRREILGRLKAQKDDLTQSAFLLFLATHYGDHPYARNVLGTESSVRSMTREDLEAFYTRWADPRNMVIALSGDVAADEALAAVRAHFADFPKREGFDPVDPIPVPPEKGIRLSEERRNKEQAHFVIGYTGVRFTDPERYAVDMLGAALAGQGGRLFTNLRDRKSLAYSVTSFSSEQVDPGFFAFYMGTSSDKVDTAIKETLQEIEEVRKGGVSREEFERAKKWMVGTYEIGLQSNSAYAERMMFNEMYGIGYEETFEAPRKIQEVTLEDVNRIAASLLSTERYSIGVIRGKE